MESKVHIKGNTQMQEDQYKTADGSTVIQKIGKGELSALG